MKDLDLNHLAVFAQIVESGSLTKASLSLGQPKSRTSRILSSLEKTLGVELIHRTTRHFQLTDIGRRFYENCRGPLNGLVEATRDLADCTEDIRGMIRLTAAQDFGNSLLAPIIDEFSRLYPKVDMNLVLSQDSLNLIQDSIDIAIRIGALKDSRLKAQKVTDIALIIVASPAFLETNPPLNRLEDLVEAPVLSMSAMKNKWSLVNGKEKRDLKLSSALTANNPEFLLQLAVRGKGVALLPDYLCLQALRSGQLIQILRSWKSEAIPIHLVYPYQKQMPPHVRRFGDFLIARLRGALGATERSLKI